MKHRFYNIPILTKTGWHRSFGDKSGSFEELSAVLPAFGYSDFRFF
jgi:hypothetical protein